MEEIYDPQFSHYQIFTQQVWYQQTPVDSKSDMTGSPSLKVIHHNMSLSVLYFRISIFFTLIYLFILF